EFRNAGRATAVFQVRSGSDAHNPRTYTVEPNKSLSDTWDFGAIGLPNCDLSVYGPNGFLRAFKGSVSGLKDSQMDVQTDYDEKNGDITLVITNLSAKTVQSLRSRQVHGATVELTINPRATVLDRRSLDRQSGWYDLVITVAADATIEYHFAGH